jgi:hypothetical protein
MNEWSGGNALAGQLAQIREGMASVPTVKQRLDMAVRQAEERLAAVKRAKEILDKNPDLEELLNIMQKSHF